jgi:hypothetical protein
MSQSSIVMPSVVSDRSFSRTAQQQLSFLNIQAYCTPRLGLAYSFFKQMIVSDLGSDLARIRQPNRIWHIPQMFDSTIPLAGMSRCLISALVVCSSNYCLHGGWCLHILTSLHSKLYEPMLSSLWLACISSELSSILASGLS